MPNSVAYLNQTSIFKWYGIRCGSKNAYSKDTCLKEMGVPAQNVITILGSIVNVIVGTYMTIE